MAEIRLENVSKSFGSAKIIEHLNLTIQDGSFTVLLGPSGCGKTTLLRMIAGIGPATSGKIYMDGEDISDVPPGKRNVAMVFQNYAIYPTMSVRENIEFCLKNNKVPKKERTERVERVAETVGLKEYLGRRPSELSGGQRQRVALARAMVKEPAVFLMDEPLSNLDAKLRLAMRSELIQLHEQLKTTFIYVTHDQMESMAMADQIVLMDQGTIMQQAAPEVIYHDPDNIFTAQFIGMPPANILELPGQAGSIGFRPERVKLNAGREKTGFRRRGKILTRELLGAEVQYKIQIPEGVVMVRSQELFFRAGDMAEIFSDREDLYFFDCQGKRIRKDMARLLELAEGRAV